MKLLEENSEEMRVDIRMGKEFLDKTPKAQKVKPKIGKWDYFII
jgi:hypothetical protein